MFTVRSPFSKGFQGTALKTLLVQDTFKYIWVLRGTMVWQGTMTARRYRDVAHPEQFVDAAIYACDVAPGRE